MKRVAKAVGEGKKKRVLGDVEIISAEEYEGLDVNAKVEVIRALIPLGLKAVMEMLDEEVTALAGRRYSRGEGRPGLARYGSNPGSVRLAGQRVRMPIPRVRNLRSNVEVPLQGLEALRGTGEVDEALLRRVLLGLSCRNYEGAAEALPGAIGLSGSSVSRQFVKASAARLREFQERDLSELDIVVMVLDGKTFAEDTMVIGLGMTMEGRKVPLGFVQTGTENARVLTAFLEGLVERGLCIDEGVLVVIDGGKGLCAAVDRGLGEKAVVQRCQWHKRENVVSYLPKWEQAEWRRRLQRAYEKPTYTEAKSALLKVREELAGRNESAAASLDEGFEETLTLHRLGLFKELGRSLKTTNCLESIISMVELRCGKVSYWRNSSQKHRWLGAALLEIEPRLHRIHGYKYLPQLRSALQEELGIKVRHEVA